MVTGQHSRPILQLAHDLRYILLNYHAYTPEVNYGATVIAKLFGTLNREHLVAVDPHGMAVEAGEHIKSEKEDEGHLVTEPVKSWRVE